MRDLFSWLTGDHDKIGGAANRVSGGMLDLADWMVPGEFDGANYGSKGPSRVGDGTGWGPNVGVNYPSKGSDRNILADILDGATNLFGNVATGVEKISKLDDNLIKSAGSAVKKQQAKQKNAGKKAAAVDPYAQMMSDLASGGSSTTTTTRMSKKEQQKAINQAILAARNPYDQAIVEARGGLKDALTVNKRLAANVKADVGGNDTRANEYNKQVNAEAAALASQAAADADMSKYGGVSGGGDAADRLARADDQRAGTALATAAGLTKASDMQAAGAREQASGINNFLLAEEAQTRGDLTKQAQKQVQRLQKERAAAIAEAKASARAGLAQQDIDLQKVVTDQRDKQMDRAIQIMGMQQSSRDKALDRAAKRSQAGPGGMDQADALKLLLQAATSEVRVPTGVKDNNGRPVYGYGAAFQPQQIDALSQSMGFRNPFSVAQPVAQQNFGASLGGWLKGLLN